MTGAPVDLDELERQLHVDVHADDYKCPRCECDVLGENEYESIFCQECAYDVAENVVPALIAELRAARATPPADHEPFAPMECCGRDRDKDGGPNPHCECPAPFKASPADEVAGLLADLAAVRAIADPCRYEDSVTRALDRIERHLRGKR